MEDSQIQNPIYYPLLASENLNGGKQTREEFQDIWAAFDALPEEKKLLIGSVEIARAIKGLQDQFGLQDDFIEALSFYIRNIIFGRLSVATLAKELDALFADSVFSGSVQEIAEQIQKKVLTLKIQPPIEGREIKTEMLAGKPQATIATLPLLQAMSKYQGIGNQMLSAERIRIKTQLDPVRGSIFNWLKYYRDELGIGHHSSVDRGQFLFRSENGRKLNPEEREKLNLLLKSLEENLPLSVDTARQEIIFPKFEYEKAPSQGSVVQPQEQAFRAQAAPVPQAGSSFIFQKGPRFGEESKPAAPQAANPFVSGKMNVGKAPSAEASPQSAKAPGNMSFSFNHVLPAEQEAPARPMPANATRPTLPKIPPMAPRKMNRFRIRPVSLSQEEENGE